MESSPEDYNLSLPVPELEESRGSSVSTTFREEYEELLKHALIAPYQPLPLSNDVPTMDSEVMSPLRKQSDHSSDSDSFQPRETFFKPTLPSAAAHLSEIAPEPYPTPSHLFQPESDLIDLELDSEDLVRETKSVPTQPPVTHHMLLTEMDRGVQQSNNTDFHLITEVRERQPASNEISTDAIELHRMNDFIDEWCGNFKHNVLADVQQIQTRLNSKVRDSINRTREERVFEVNSLQRELESMRELVARYEQSLVHRNQAIDGVTRSLSKVRRTCNLRRYWSVWREGLCEARGLSLKLRLAEQSNVRRLRRKAWEAWRSIIVGKWKARVERACQARAQQVCTQLTADYELKLATSENALFETREEVKTLTRDRETYEETMKKAFMRGVCALSMEAMTMFQPPDVLPPQPETTEALLPPEPLPDPLPPSTSSNYVPIAKSLKKSHISSTSTSTLAKPKDSQPPISIHSLKRTNIAPSRGNKHKVLVQRHAPAAY